MSRRGRRGGGARVRPSPFAIAVRVALNAKGVPHAYVEEDLVDKSDLLLASSPVHRKVPVLIHNGRPVCDSRVILQYVDEAWAAADPAARPARPRRRPLLGRLRPRRGGPGVASVREGEAPPFFGGDGVGYVDAVLGGFLPWFAAIEEMAGGGVKLVDAERTPRLAAWAERFRTDDAASGVLPSDAGEVVE
ncbi:hypothetical protein ACP70R_019346 [Stipagrostis hirtigluma subsp. patula]